MNRRLLLLAPAAAIGALLSSCGTVGLDGGGGGDYAGTTINSRNQALIQRETRAVFAAKGFSYSGGTATVLRFSKQGSRSAQITWGTNLNGNPVYFRPEVRLQPLGDRTRLSCEVFITQQSTVYGENVRQPFLGGRAGYNAMMSDIRQRVERAEKAAGGR